MTSITVSYETFLGLGCLCKGVCLHVVNLQSAKARTFFSFLWVPFIPRNMSCVLTPTNLFTVQMSIKFLN